MRLKTGRTFEAVAQFGDFLRALARQRGEAGVGEAHGLQHAQVGGVGRQAVLADAGLHVDDRLELGEEPRVDLAALVHFFERDAHAQRLGDHAQAIRRRRADRGADGVLAGLAFLAAGDLDLVEAGQAGFQAAQRLLQRFLRRCGRSP